jgi:hypothetical protein
MRHAPCAAEVCTISRVLTKTRPTARRGRERGLKGAGDFVERGCETVNPSTALRA